MIITDYPAEFREDLILLEQRKIVLEEKREYARNAAFTRANTIAGGLVLSIFLAGLWGVLIVLLK